VRLIVFLLSRVRFFNKTRLISQFWNAWLESVLKPACRADNILFRMNRRFINFLLRKCRKILEFRFEVMRGQIWIIWKTICVEEMHQLKLCWVFIEESSDLRSCSFLWEEHRRLIYWARAEAQSTDRMFFAECISFLIWELWWNFYFTILSRIVAEKAKSNYWISRMKKQAIKRFKKIVNFGFTNLQDEQFIGSKTQKSSIFFQKP
jgi:hypothetical protein